jgi:hypothetical protein
MADRKPTKHFSPNALGMWRRALRESALSTNSKCVGLVLACWVNGDMRAWPGRKRLAAESSLSLHSVDRAIGDLEDSGFVIVYPPKRIVNGVEKRVGGRKKTNEYTLVIPSQERAPDVPSSEKEGKSEDERGQTGEEKSATGAHELALRATRKDLAGFAPEDQLGEKKDQVLRHCGWGECMALHLPGSLYCEKHAASEKVA